jgi:hypothetical protein
MIPRRIACRVERRRVGVDQIVLVDVPHVAVGLLAGISNAMRSTFSRQRLGSMPRAAATARHFFTFSGPALYAARMKSFRAAGSSAASLK